MDNEILEFIKYLSIKSLCIGIIAFFLTMLIKWPLKKLTAKLSEEKRKAVNIAILIIPVSISLILSMLYYGIFKSNWLTISIVDTGISSWFISLSIYAIYERILMIIKAIKSGKIKIDNQLTKETINFLKSSLKDLNTIIKEKEKNLKDISEKIKSLDQIKNMLESAGFNKDIAKLSETNIEIQALQNEKKFLQNQITQTQNQIESYTQQLYLKKGE